MLATTTTFAHRGRKEQGVTLSRSTDRCATVVCVKGTAGTAWRRAHRGAALLVAACAALAAVPTLAAADTRPPTFADWTSSASNLASGTLGESPITLSGTFVATTATGTVLDDSATTFAGSAFTPPLPKSDQIGILGGSGASYTVTFGRATANPVLHLWSLASKLTFPVGTTVTKVSGDAGLSVSANTATGTLNGPAGPPAVGADASGTVRLSGTYTTLTFAAEPVPGVSQDGIAVQVGASPPDAAIGDLDPDWNGGRWTLLNPPDATDTKVADLLLDGQGRTAISGSIQRSSSTDGLLERLGATGTPDPDFGGGDGLVDPQFGQMAYPQTDGHGLAWDPVAGLTAGWSTYYASYSRRLVTTRYDDAGNPDTGYGDGGNAIVDPGLPADGSGNTVALRRTLGLADGSTILVGELQDGNGDAGWLRIVKLDPGGLIDTSFGTNGRVTFVDPPGQPLNAGMSIVDAKLDSAGRILVLSNGFKLMRFTADGHLDTTFGGGDGIATVSAADPTYNYPATYGRAIALDSAGSIYLAGSATTQSGPQTGAVAKLTPSGTLDSTFGARRVPIPSQEATGDALVVQGDGKVLLVGTYGRLYTPNILRHMMFTRLLPTGALDTSFGTNGQILKNVGSGGDTTVADATQTASGKLVVAGVTAKPSSGTEGFVARYVVRDPSSFQPPENTQPPSLSGTPTPGATLTCNVGQWAHSPTVVNVVWERAPRSTTSPSDPAWHSIAGSSGSTRPATATYTVQAEDLGSRVRCREVASNGDGSDTSPSASKRVDAGPPTNLTPPTQSGTPVTDHPLVCSVGTWTNGADTTVQWLRGDTPIGGANNATYTVRDADRRSQVSCLVTAANDVGTGVPLRSGTQLAVGDPPAIQKAPSVTLARTGPKATDVRLSCAHGTWDEDYGAYDYRWERAGAQIAGAIGQTYDATVNDLGEDVNCVVTSTNPAGRSQPERSNQVLVPLPSNGAPGLIYRAGGFNRLDPVNMMAVSGGFLDAIKDLVVQRRAAATQTAIATCRNGPNANAPLPDFAKYSDAGSGYYIGPTSKSYCGILLHDFRIRHVPTGSYWLGGICRLPGQVLPGFNPCPKLGIPVAPLNAATPPASLTPMEQQRLAALKPLRVLWDFNHDGKTDAECAPDAPILRSLYSRGNYNVRAVIVSADSQATGQYSITDLPMNFFATSSTQGGELRDGQPFACKTSLEPPPEPQLPCVNEVAIGRVHVEGNLCPISARRVPPAELDGLPLNVQKMLEDQALNTALRRRSALRATDPVGLGQLRAVPGSIGYDATAQISALSTIDGAKEATVPSSWASALKKNSSFDVPNAQFAMDQIYIAKGTAKVNGVDVDPVGSASTVLVPTDAGHAIDGIKKMTISSTKAATTLGGLPIGDPGKLSTDLADKLGVSPPPLRGANLDALKDALKSKLNLGPFKLTGDAKLRLADDGTAFLDAYAELPALLTGPGSSPIRTAVTIRASRDGKITLQGVHLNVSKAYLGGVVVRNLALDYDGGLSVTGQLVFPPVNQGISINRFRIDNQGHFQELDVSYLAGTGQGINIGPGIFLTKLGGGLSLSPDEIRARATVSVGPSTGGGCPTAGVDTDLNVHFAPAPFFVDAHGTVEIVCIPVGNAHFYADSTGLVDLQTHVSLDLGLIYVSADMHGTLQLPRWQIDIHGKGGIRHLFSGEVKGMLSNYGIAGCGRVEIFPETPFTDSVTIAGGAGIHFSNGRPPFTYAELLANLDAFTGCSLRSWSPFGRDARAVISPRGTGSRAETGSTFTINAPAPKVIPLQLTGAGGAPKVRIRTPAGKVLDATGFGESFTKTADISGATDAKHARTVLFLRGATGTFTVEPAAGSPRIVDMRRSEILPDPKVVAKVFGHGANRTLRYSVAKIAGQQVRFVEHSPGAQRVIATVKTGGTGRKAFITSEGKGTARTVVAEVVQDGLARDNLTVAKFRAPSPKAGRARRVRVRRSGSHATVTWSAAAYAKTYEVAVRTGRGRSLLLTPTGKRRTVRITGLVKGEGASVRVVALTPAGRRGKAATARLAGTLRYVSVKPKVRPHLKKKKSKTKHHH
jgi:uncharacterized delta-60 repeat protein